MSKPYMNDVQKIAYAGCVGPVLTVWTPSERQKLESAFEEKGYWVLPVSRICHTGTRHDAIICYRDESSTIIEYLFSQRISFEIEAESSNTVGIIFVYNTTVDEIIGNIQHTLSRRG